MFLKELYKAIGIDLEVHNLIVDFTLSDGTRAHDAFQAIGNTVKSTKDMVDLVREQIPEGSRICLIMEIEGDYELPELMELATSPELFWTAKRCVFMDEELAKEYVDEVRGGCPLEPDGN